jgi:hypothetical protein
MKCAGNAAIVGTKRSPKKILVRNHEKQLPEQSKRK